MKVIGAVVTTKRINHMKLDNCDNEIIVKHIAVS